MASPEGPDDTVAGPAGGHAEPVLPVVRAHVRVYRPRRYSKQAFFCGFVVAALVVGGVAWAVSWWIR